MLKAFKELTDKTEGRYATDIELQFIVDYLKSYQLRLSTYQKLQALEEKFVDEVYKQVVSIDPKLLRSGQKDLNTKWKRDTMRVLRYSATALLLDDAELHQERFLFWFQTIMRAFGAQRSCEVTYLLMQEVTKKHLSSAEAALFCPILELNCSALGVET